MKKKNDIEWSANRCPICREFMQTTEYGSQEYCEKCGVWYNL
jgi:uncharacterized CHY-type Zn-finger protein